MSIYRKKNNQFIKLNNYVVTKDNNKYFICTRTLDNGVEYYDIPESAMSSFSMFASNTIYALSLESNTTTNPKLRYGSQVLDIKRDGSQLEIGQLDGLLRLYTKNVNTTTDIYLLESDTLSPGGSNEILEITITTYTTSVTSEGAFIDYEIPANITLNDSTLVRFNLTYGQTNFDVGIFVRFKQNNQVIKIITPYQAGTSTSAKLTDYLKHLTDYNNDFKFLGLIKIVNNETFVYPIMEHIIVDTTMNSSSKNPVANSAVENSKMNKVNPTGTGYLSINRNNVGVTGDYSATLGYMGRASGTCAISMGYFTRVGGNYGAAFNLSTRADGEAATSMGSYTKASRKSQFVFGQYNIDDTSGANTGSLGDYIEIVGNGTADNARSNARTLDWSGNEVLAGTLKTAGLIDGNNASYKLTIPNTTSWTADKIIATSDEVTNKMDKANPTGTGSLSINRKANSTVGANSVALGSDTEASGNSSISIGYGGTASGFASLAGGSYSTASGSTSIAFGNNAKATGTYTVSLGDGTTANHKSQVVFGEYNEADTSANASSARGDYIEIVGNGTSVLAKSNARTLDWNGNEYLAGNLQCAGFTDGTTTKTMTQILSGGSTQKYLHTVRCQISFYSTTYGTVTLWAILSLVTTFTDRISSETYLKMAFTEQSLTGTSQDNAKSYYFSVYSMDTTNSKIYSGHMGVWLNTNSNAFKSGGSGLRIYCYDTANNTYSEINQTDISFGDVSFSNLSDAVQTL